MIIKLFENSIRKYVLLESTLFQVLSVQSVIGDVFLNLSQLNLHDFNSAMLSVQTVFPCFKTIYTYCYL